MVYKNKSVNARAIQNLYRKSPKYFKKMFLTYFILLAVIFLAAAYTVSLRSGADESYEEFANKTMQLEKFKRDTDIVFDTTDMICELVSKDSVTNEYAHERIDGYSGMNFQKMYELSRTLMRIQTDFAGYNLNIAMTRLSDDIIITGDGETETVKSFMDSSGIDVFKAASGLDGANEKSYIIPSDTLADKVSVIYKKDFEGANSVYYIMVFNKDNIKFICNNGYKYIFSDYDEEYANAVLTGNYSFSEPGEIEYIDVRGTASCFFTLSDSQNDMIYVKCFKVRNDSNIAFIVLLCIMLVMCAAAIALMLAKYSYYPLRDIFSKLGMNSVTGVDEFEAIGDRIDDIMENNSNMKKSIENQTNIIKNRFLFDVLNGFIWGEGLSDEAMENGFSFITGKCIVVVMDIDKDERINGDGVGGIYESLKERFSEYDGAALCCISETRYVLICDKSKTEKKTILEDVDYVRFSLGIPINAAISESGEDRKLSDVYHFLSGGLDNKSLTNKRDIITDSDIRQTGKNDNIYPSETESMLADYVVNGEETKALYCLKNIFSASEETFGENLDVFKYAMIVTIKRIFAKLDTCEEEIFGSQVSIVREINHASDAGEVFTVIKQIMEMIIDYAAKNKTVNSSNLADDIIEYIDSNLQNDVSVSDVSDKFGISPSYISRLLRDNYNTSFKSYLNDARIKKAKQMMDENKNILIKDLAASLGYNNVVSFIRMFKKNEGISPGEYLKMK